MKRVAILCIPKPWNWHRGTRVIGYLLTVSKQHQIVYSMVCEAGHRYCSRRVSSWRRTLLGMKCRDAPYQHPGTRKTTPSPRICHSLAIRIPSSFLLPHFIHNPLQAAHFTPLGGSRKGDFTVIAGFTIQRPMGDGLLLMPITLLDLKWIHYFPVFLVAVLITLHFL